MDVKRLSSRCFSGPNLRPGDFAVLCTLQLQYICFPLVIFLHSRIKDNSMYTITLQLKKYRSSCSFKRKRASISLSSLPCRKSLTLGMCTQSSAHANSAKIVPSRDGLCNTRESP